VKEYHRRVFLVAVAELATPIDLEAAALATDLGITAYEARLKIAVPSPAIVLTSADPGAAAELARKLRGRGHGVLSCDAADVVSSSAMVPLRRFTFEEDALVADDVPGARLPYTEILGIFRAMHETRTETRTQSKGSQFSAGRALLTGGLMVTKSVSRDEKTVTQEREQVCYLFPRGGKTPWLLPEQGTKYAGLGAEAGPSSAHNFVATLARLRKLASGAHYDERLMSPRNAPSRPIRTGTSAAETVGASSASGVDLLAHLLARWAAGEGRR
jgi:hypothetical protein